MRKIVLFLIGVLLLANLTLAQVAEPGDVEIQIKALKDAISAGGVAEFNVTITNNMRFDDTFRIKFSDDVEWTILTDPLTYKFSEFPLRVGESAKFLVKIRASPSASLGYNVYVIRLNVFAKATGNEQTAHLTYGYGPQFLTPKEYAALVIASVDVPAVVDPRGAMQIRVHLRNKNPLNITDLLITAKSAIVDQEVEVNLGPLEEKDVYITQELNPLESPKQDTLIIEITRAGETIVSLERGFEVIAYSMFKKTTEEKKALLKNTYVINVVNQGNQRTTNFIRHPTSFGKALFSGSEPDARLVKLNGNRFLEWSLELGPNESAQIRIVENYWPIVFVLLLIIVTVVLYFVLRSPIVVRKSAMIVTTKEGGISGLKIVLNIKNRSNKLVGEVKLVDSIPNIAVVDKDFGVGSLEPEKVVKHAKKGTLLKWNIGDMEKGEERVLSYKVTSRLTILGSFSLPAAVTKFVAKGKEKIAYSNRLRITT